MEGTQTEENKKDKTRMIVVVVGMILLIALTAFSTYKFTMNGLKAGELGASNTQYLKTENKSCFDEGILVSDFNGTTVTLLIRGVNGTCYDINKPTLRFDYKEPYKVVGSNVKLKNETVKSCSLEACQ